VHLAHRQLRVGVCDANVDSSVAHHPLSRLGRTVRRQTPRRVAVLLGHRPRQRGPCGPAPWPLSRVVVDCFREFT
jgi:hypothetical protein